VVIGPMLTLLFHVDIRYAIGAAYVAITVIVLALLCYSLFGGGGL
jgi:hypothetical protein